MFNNMKISTRLTLAFTVVVLITLTISTLSYMRMGLMNQNTNKIVVDLYPKTETAHDIIENVNLISLAIRNTLLFVDNKRDGMLSAQESFVDGEDACFDIHRAPGIGSEDRLDLVGYFVENKTRIRGLAVYIRF